MGGGDSEVTRDDDAGAARVRELPARAPCAASAKRHALHTEASHRFERGADVGRVLPAVLDRAAALIAELAGGTVLAGPRRRLPEAPPSRAG